MGWLRAPAVLVVCVAVGVAATNATHPPDGPAGPPQSRETTTRRGSPRPAATAGDRAALQVATRYALAATNWTAQDRLAAWRAESALATPGYRRQLGHAQPDASARRELRRERARNQATLTRSELIARAGARARATVWLNERTRTRTRSLAGQTRNQVRLQQQPDGRWLVSGWTTATDGIEG